MIAQWAKDEAIRRIKLSAGIADSYTPTEFIVKPLAEMIEKHETAPVDPVIQLARSEAILYLNAFQQPVSVPTGYVGGQATKHSAIYNIVNGNGDHYPIVDCLIRGIRNGQKL